MFCVEESRETSSCGAECAWRRSPGTGLGPALHSSTWGSAHPATCLGKPASGRTAGGGQADACRVPRASSLELAPPLGREGCGWPQAVPSLLGNLCAPPTTHLRSLPFVIPCPVKAWGHKGASSNHFSDRGTCCGLNLSPLKLRALSHLWDQPSAPESPVSLERVHGGESIRTIGALEGVFLEEGIPSARDWGEIRKPGNMRWRSQDLKAWKGDGCSYLGGGWWGSLDSALGGVKEGL